MNAKSFWRGVRVTAVSSAFVCAMVAAGGYFDRDPYHLYPAQPPARPIGVVNISGDMGLRFLLGASTSRGLTAAHVPVVGIATPVLFRRHRSAADVDRIVAGTIRTVRRRRRRATSDRATVHAD